MTLAEQKRLKPKVEDVLPKYLNDDMMRGALAFIAFLRENKINPALTNYNSWKAVCKGESLLYIRICDADHYQRSRPGVSWVITLYFTHMSEYGDIVESEGLQSIFWNNVSYYCKSCRACAPGKDIILFGKEFKSVCINVPLIWAFDPDETTLNGMKRLLELEKAARYK